MFGVATRVTARTFEYEIWPFSIALLMSGKLARARATRIFSRPGVEADAPGQPMCARLGALLAPTPFLVELTEKDEEPVVRILHLSGKDGDFFGKLVVANRCQGGKRAPGGPFSRLP